MYKPAPLRPRKTDNVRSRTGCKSCRERRTKCDERKPTCGTCARLSRVCESFKPQYKFRISTVSRSETQHKEVERNQPQIPSLSLIESLQHTDRDVFYTTYWEDRCMPALHPMFYDALRLYSNVSVLKDAILALSSCNTSRSVAEVKFPPSITCGGAHRPSLVHQTRSQLYYSRAVTQFASLSFQDCQSHLKAALTVIVIFAYIESSMGNLEAFDCHVRGFEILLDTLRTENGSPFIKALLTAWMQPRFMVWWSRAYYSSVELQKQLSSILLPRILRSSFDSFAERRVLVLSIMCESHRLNIKAILGYWGTFNSPAPLEHTDPEETCELLMTEAQKLDDWLLHLPQSEQPMIEESAFPDMNIHFQSHEAALNYAYYVVARIMQCTTSLRQLSSRDPQWLGNECSDAEPWVRLLLRIAHGSNMKAALTRNNYTIGFSGLLLAACLRCQDEALSSAIESWLQSLEDLQPTEEGSFPIFQALSAVKAINRERLMGKDVFAVSQPVFNAGRPKFGCYCAQPISSLLAHGKVRATGDLFTEEVAMERQRRQKIQPQLMLQTVHG